MHIGIIPDGNRRWAKKMGLSHSQLLEHWFKNIFEKVYLKLLTGELDEFKKEFRHINEISLYVLSTKNLERKDKTFELVFKLMKKMFITILSNEVALEACKKICLNLVGELKMLPSEIQDMLKIATTKICTADSINAELTINLAIAYDPVLDMKRLTSDIGGLRNSGGSVDNGVREQTPIDFVIRTGGEMRSSGFFPFHTLYSEWYYSNLYFPEFTLSELNKALGDFRKRERRYGH